jgi:hypothetical protein
MRKPGSVSDLECWGEKAWTEGRLGVYSNVGNWPRSLAILNGSAQPARKTAWQCELVHITDAGKAPLRRCDAGRNRCPILPLALSITLLSTPFKIVCLFCVLGLMLTAAIVPMIVPEDLTWSHIEDLLT